MPTKQCYAHAFVILAASSALLAGRPGAKELLDEALALYDLRFWNEEEGLSCDTWNTGFTVLDDYRGLNANMHTVEAFLAAADVTGDEKYRVRAGRIIDHVSGWAKQNQWRIPEHFTKDWIPDLECNREKPDDPFKPYGATPGHGIEWARLIVQWALSTWGGPGGEAGRYLTLRKIFTTGQCRTRGRQTALLESCTPRTGTESRWFMTECTGRWQRRSIPLRFCTMSPGRSSMQKITRNLCSIWMRRSSIMSTAPGSISWTAKTCDRNGMAGEIGSLSCAAGNADSALPAGSVDCGCSKRKKAVETDGRICLTETECETEGRYRPQLFC